MLSETAKYYSAPKRPLMRGDWKRVRGKLFCIALKVIPLKLFYYQTFFETWRNEHLGYEHYKNAIKIWGHRACLRVSRLLKWGIFTGCALKVRITFIQN